MDVNFWLQRWELNQIAFHESAANPLLLKHFQALQLTSGSRVFLPLCGKSLDIAWLLSKGYRVAGAELSKNAVEQLFADLGVVPVISQENELARYSSDNIDIFVGDIFALDSEILGPIDAIYDRAALVALPADMRVRYSAHLITLSHNAAQLLLSYAYDQRLMDGPPFSVTQDEVHQHYGVSYELQRLASIDVEGGLKGKCAAVESVWLLSPNK